MRETSVVHMVVGLLLVVPVGLRGLATPHEQVWRVIPDLTEGQVPRTTPGTDGLS